MRIVKMALLSSALALVACASTSDTKSDEQAAHKVESKGVYKVSKKNCETKSETLKYTNLIGKDVTVEMLWHSVDPSAQDIRYPFKVTGYTDEGLVIYPHQFPLQELYMGLLFSSGHLIHRGQKMIMDTCSANITEQDEMSPYHH